MRRARRNAKRQGEVAELAFMHKAASLGFGVAKPYGDSFPYDFILDSGKKLWRVQVKSTNQMFQGAYAINAQRRLGWGTCPYKAREVDIVAAYVVPLDCWYIVPLRAMRKKKSMRVYPHAAEKDGRYGRYKEAWKVME